MRYVLMFLGGLVAIVGGIWTLQGVGVLPGSFVTGQTFWAVAGVTPGGRQNALDNAR